MAGLTLHALKLLPPLVSCIHHSLQSHPLRLFFCYPLVYALYYLLVHCLLVFQTCYCWRFTWCGGCHFLWGGTRSNKHLVKFNSLLFPLWHLTHLPFLSLVIPVSFKRDCRTPLTPMTMLYGFYFATFMVTNLNRMK